MGRGQFGDYSIVLGITNTIKGNQQWKLRAGVPSLVWELRSHKPWSMAKKNKKDCLTYAKSASQRDSAFYTFWDKVECN